MAAVMSACGGEDEYEPPTDYVAPEAPCEGCSDDATPCRGTPMGECEGLDIELCVAMGCELRYVEEEEAAECIGEEAPACETMTTRDQCVAIRGCTWAE